jgi:tRNA-Thr(GGU) m(6)t(6)A37 methyltransferase TsaA
MFKPNLFVAAVVCVPMAMLIAAAATIAGPASGGVRGANQVAPNGPSAATGAAGEREMTYSLSSLGIVKRQGARFVLVLDPKYAPGLVSLADFSHVMVFYWCDKNDTPERRAFLQGYRKNKASPLTGVFATRSPARPNPIAITTCRILAISDNIVEIEWIDAFDGSPIIDLKPYIPRNDSFPNAKTPTWVQ